MPPEIIDLLSSSPEVAKAAPQPRASRSQPMSSEQLDDLWSVIEGGILGEEGIPRTARSDLQRRAGVDANEARQSPSHSSEKRKRSICETSETISTNHAATCWDTAPRSDITTPARNHELSAAHNAFLDRIVANNHQDPIIISSPDQVSPACQANFRPNHSGVPPSSPPENVSSPQHRGPSRNETEPSSVPMTYDDDPEVDAFVRTVLEASKPETWSDLEDPLDPENAILAFSSPDPSTRPHKQRRKRSFEVIDMTAPNPTFTTSRHTSRSSRRSSSTSQESRSSKVSSRNSSMGQYFSVSKNPHSNESRKKVPLKKVSEKEPDTSLPKGKSTIQDDTILFTSDAIDPTATHEESTAIHTAHNLQSNHYNERTSHDTIFEDPIDTSACPTQPQKRSKTTNSSRTSTLSIFDIGNDPIGLSSDTDPEIDEEVFGEDQASSSANLSILEKIRKLNQSSGHTQKKKKKPVTAVKLDYRDPIGSEEDEIIPVEPAPSAKQTKPSEKRASQPKLTSEERAARAAERQQQKEAEKAAKAKQRQAEKEERQRLKFLESELAEVNKRQKDRKQTALEIIVDLPVSLDETTKILAKECFGNAHIETAMIGSAVPNVITFRRKITREWDAKNYTFRPIPQKIMNETHAICILKAKDLAQLVQSEANGDNDTVGHLATRIENAHPNYNQLYIIEGLNQFLKTRANRAQREFVDQVRGALTQSETSAPAQRRRRPAQADLPDVSEEQIDDALQHLEVEHFAKISHTSSPAETVTLLQRLTEYISLIRHSPEQTTLADAGTSFCLAAGQLSTGADARDAKGVPGNPGID
ncbi:hypothetical protein AAP_03903 [Ascosphaera apis ARSEF 7405]|uniref:ERCC4 domain-containing protein n=1 Tax=Ascosphaera apis ARSEF 7405 TaxID=392613 RepID=A0A162I9G0_9EURO|nr:hypothetical protein AAP_03903 [Ascosphaera apis ARSEF 7405]